MRYIQYNILFLLLLLIKYIFALNCNTSFRNKYLSVQLEKAFQLEGSWESFSVSEKSTGDQVIHEGDDNEQSKVL